MAMTAAELVKADQEHLIHPLHHPIDNAEPLIYVRGRGATIQEIGGHEYIDGLSGLWNVNVGHGRTELADAAAARELDETILREGPDTVAGFIGEPIHGGGGVIYPTDDYWPRVREVCTRHKVLLIGDEVITGFCRTGRWFALSHWDVKPDIMSFAKGVTSGYLPLGGIMVTKAIKQAMDSVKPEGRWMHAYTYSGHPTCCAVALKNLD